MKKFLLMALCAIATLASCGGDDEEQQDNSTEILQNEAYTRVKDNIVGKWVATEIYNDGTYSDYYNEKIGWCKIHSGSDLGSYEFKSDGTFSEKTLTGTYKIYKNDYYLQTPNYSVPTYIEFDYKNGIPATKRGITIDGGYLRIYSITNMYGTEYADFDDYPANYKYSKQ